MYDKKEQVTYFDRNGIKKFTLNAGRLYTRADSWRSFSFEYDDTFGRVANLRPASEKLTLSVIFGESGTAGRDEVLDAFLEDIIAGSPGTIEIRGWRLSCYIVSGKPTMVGRTETEFECEVIPANEAIWTRETLYTFRGAGEAGSGEDLGRDYGMEAAGAVRGYDYGYSAALQNSQQLSLSGSGNGYILDVYGPATNPTVYIDGAPVTVFATIRSGEKLRIVSNGNDKRIERIGQSGAISSLFNARDKERSPFLALGASPVISYGSIKFDFTAIERRVIPAWN